ncbi:hypothetical protein EVAR_31525_1 [Eumeta japonica]|uniref:Uncharacterized protein n=1 Tax=Eumeta variegata TaxID=151549 RepID=A0A4C1Z1Y1_EUMVA|nr:hypothetical protein EVAR_31525_1 [Eumeta japonica]
MWGRQAEIACLTSAWRHKAAAAALFQIVGSEIALAHDAANFYPTLAQQKTRKNGPENRYPFTGVPLREARLPRNEICCGLRKRYAPAGRLVAESTTVIRMDSCTVIGNGIGVRSATEREVDVRIVSVMIERLISEGIYLCPREKSYGES